MLVSKAIVSYTLYLDERNELKDEFSKVSINLQ